MKKLHGECVRQDTMVSDDGRTVLVVLRVDRRDYEFARSWAEYHVADPSGTAEEQLEGRLNMALLMERQDSDWPCPPEIDALYPDPKPVPKQFDMGDDIPF